jgi:hypothetical protein
MYIYILNKNTQNRGLNYGKFHNAYIVHSGAPSSAGHQCERISMRDPSFRSAHATDGWLDTTAAFIDAAGGQHRRR